MKSKIKVLVLLNIVLITGIIFYFRSPEKPTRPAMELPPVRVSEAITQNVPYFLEGLGLVNPSNDVLVTSRVDGHLLKLHFQEGQRVKAGDLLAELDPRPLEAKLAEAKGTLARDQAQLVNAKRDLERYSKLASGDFIARQQYENQNATVRQLEGTIAADEAAVEAASLQIEYSRITAPVSGRLGLRNVEIGNMVKASDASGLVRITEVSPCNIIFTLPERYVHRVITAMRKMAPAKLSVQAWNKDTLLATGYLESIDNQIDVQTATIKLKAVFENSDYALFANQFVTARLLVEKLDNVVTVPAAAVQLGVKGSYLYVINKEQQAELRNIKTGISLAEISVITEGLEAGELVVVDGLDRLRDKSKVNVVANTPCPRVDQ